MTADSTDHIRPLAHLNGEKPPAPPWFTEAIDAPSEECEIIVEGAKIRYSAWGERGKPGLLFIHGGRAHRNWWRPFAPAFTNKMRVAAIDLSGMGDSDWREKYSLEVRIKEVFAVIDDAGLSLAGNPIVVGHSFGGWITLGCVQSGGEKLAGAVVIDSPLGLPDPHEGYSVGRHDGNQKRKTPRVDTSLIDPIKRFRFLPSQPCEHLFLMDYIAREGLRKTDPGADPDGWIWKFDPNADGDYDLKFESDLLLSLIHI